MTQVHRRWDNAVMAAGLEVTKDLAGVGFLHL